MTMDNLKHPSRRFKRRTIGGPLAEAVFGAGGLAHRLRARRHNTQDRTMSSIGTSPKNDDGTRTYMLVESPAPSDSDLELTIHDEDGSTTDTIGPLNADEVVELLVQLEDPSRAKVWREGGDIPIRGDIALRRLSDAIQHQPANDDPVTSDDEEPVFVDVVASVAAYEVEDDPEPLVRVNGTDGHCPRCGCAHGTDGEFVVDGALVSCHCECHGEVEEVSTVETQTFDLDDSSVIYRGRRRRCRTIAPIRRMDNRSRLIEITRNGAKLPCREDVRRIGQLRDWGATSEGPASERLALDLAIDALGDVDRALAVYETLAEVFLTRLAGDEWSISGAGLRHAIEGIEEALEVAR